VTELKEPESKPPLRPNEFEIALVIKNINSLFINGKLKVLTGLWFLFYEVWMV
jgi:hypothetical protein